MGQKRGPYIRAALYLHAEQIHRSGRGRHRITVFVRILMEPFYKMILTIYYIHTCILLFVFKKGTVIDMMAYFALACASSPLLRTLLMNSLTLVRQLLHLLISLKSPMLPYCARPAVCLCLLEGDTPHGADTNVYFLALVMVRFEAM